MSPTPVVDPQRYTRVAVVLHWVIAGLILFNLALGYLMGGITPPKRFPVVETHITVGLTVLLLTTLRILWRLGHRPPTRETRPHPRERLLANTVHLGLYGAMVLMPLSGWAVISANPPPGSVGWQARAAVLPPTVAAALDRHGPLTLLHLAPVPLIARWRRSGRRPRGGRRRKRCTTTWRAHMSSAASCCSACWRCISPAR